MRYGILAYVGRWIVIAVLIGVGVAIAIAWGPTAAVAYLFPLLVAFMIVWAARAGGEFITDVSRRRFEHRERS